MRILVTRPQPDADLFAADLAARGHEPLAAPLMTIAMRGDATLPLDGAQAILLTSANGARALAAYGPGEAALALPVFAVGQATADAARDAGFTGIEAAGGDVDSLAALVAQTLKPGGGHLVHIAGRERAGDLKAALGAHGFDVEIAVLYSAEAVDVLPGVACRALRDGRLDGVTLFSPRSAALYAALVAKAGLAEQARMLRHFALSPAVAEALLPLRLARVAVARRPERAALLDAVDEADV